MAGGAISAAGTVVVDAGATNPLRLRVQYTPPLTGVNGGFNDSFTYNVELPGSGGLNFTQTVVLQELTVLTPPNVTVQAREGTAQHLSLGT